MKRRKLLLGIGGVAAGGSALIGSGAFTSVEAQRGLTVEVADDPSAFLGLDECPDSPNSEYATVTPSGLLEVDMTDDNATSAGGEGINDEAVSLFDQVFQVCNQGTQDVCLWVMDDADWPMTGDGEPRIDFYLGDDDEDSILGAENATNLGVGSCVCIGIRTDTRGLDSESETLLDSLDDAVTIVADAEADCGEEAEPAPEPECTECTAPDPGTDDFETTIESIDNSNFPTVEVTTRVDTTAGGNGELDASNFQLCEETIEGLGDGYCGQGIESITFGGEQEETLADIMFVIDTSGSMGGDKIDNAKDGAIELIGGDTDTNNDANDGGFDPTVNVGLVEFASSANLVSDLGTDQNQVEEDIDNLGASGQTDIEDGIDVAQEEFDTSDANRDNAPDYMIVLGNGDTSGGKSAADDAKNAGTTIYGIAYGSGASVSDFEDISGEEPSDPDYEDYTFDADVDDITDIFDEIGQAIFGTYTLEYVSSNFETDGTDREVLVYVDDEDEGDADTTVTYTAPSS